MPRLHLTSLRCGTGQLSLSAFPPGWVVVTTLLDITACMCAASRRPGSSVLLGLNITSAKARWRHFSPQGLSLCVPTVQSERKKEEKSTPAIPAMWVLPGEDSDSESCFLIGHDLHPNQTKKCKSFLQLHNLYHTFKYCTNAKAELTSLKEGALINIKDNFRTSKNFHKTLRIKSSENLINVAYATGCANIKLNCLKNYMQIKYNTAINKAYL